MGKTVISLIIMVVSSGVGLFVGGLLNNMVGGMILFALISGIACIIHTLEKMLGSKELQKNSPDLHVAP